DADQVLDLNSAAQNATVFVTIAYAEAQSDPSTAAGVPGNTRVTESATIGVVTTAPPTDGSVVRLARFTMTGNGDVPGNPNDEIDGGVRQAGTAKLGGGPG